MATMRFIIFAAACVCAYAFPMEPTVPMTRNTIFADEKLEGGIFENLGKFDLLDAARNTGDNSSAYRLPTTTRPHHYDVLWLVNIAEFLFGGTVSIQLYATEAGLNEIVLHSSEMTLTSVQLYLNNALINTNYTEEEATQFLRVQLDDPTHTTLQYSATTPVLYTLTIAFNAPLRTNMYGIYRSWFRNSNTAAVSWMASTQFQATAARWAFPCYDEPAFKATFDIIIRRPVGYRSWSCTRQSSTVPAITGYEDDIYYRTPIMSTYLLAIIVAQYNSLAQLENGVLRYEVIARPGALSVGQGNYAFETGMALLEEMSNHTAMDYYGVHNYLKMTQAAIPDFGAGAMENWGLLTYREAYLMYDTVHTNSYFKQLIAYILSHEIAHMWFGNLVTCDWWDVLWLNEGFARYYQYFLTDWVEDYMGLETRFITEQIHTSLLSDSANNPHPLSTTSIGTNAQVSAMFSTISYNKGAAIIRQTEHLLGFDIHREGLRNYLVKMAHKTALPIDLFESLEEAAVANNAISEYGRDFNFIDYYKSWTEQPGHPVINVQVNHQTGEMTIYQRRFNINTGYSAVGNNYIIPITFATASNPDFEDTKPTYVINKAVTTIPRGNAGVDEWVVFNKQQTGFYRVNYDDYTWDLIVAALRGPNRTHIHEYNRAQIVNDVFQFARSNLITYTRALNILSFLDNETEYAPWVAALTGFSWIRNRLVGTTHLTRLENQIITWSATVIGELGYTPRSDDEDFMVSYLRYQLAPTLCIINAPGCRASAQSQFVALRDTGLEVPKDSRNWVYCNGLRYGTPADFTFLWNRFNAHNVYTEKIQLLMVLGCTPHEASLNTFLEAIIADTEVIRPQDYSTSWSSAVTGNEGNTDIVFRFVQNNLVRVVNAFGSATGPLGPIASRLRTIAQINSFQQWLALPTVRETINDAQYNSLYASSEDSRNSIAWAEEVQNDFNNYFDNGDTAVTTSTSAPSVTPPIITIAPGALVQPSTPDLPERDAAATIYVSMLVLAFAVMANLIF